MVMGWSTNHDFVIRSGLSVLTIPTMIATIATIIKKNGTGGNVCIAKPK